MAEFFFGAVNVSFQGPEGQSERSRRFLVRAAALEAKRDRGPLGSGKSGHRLLEIEREFGGRKGRGFVVIRRQWPGAIEGRAPAHAGEEEPVGDAAQPGAPGRFAAIGRELLPRPEEGLLREIVRRRMIARREPAQEVPQEGLVPSDQSRVRRFVARVLEHADNQFGIGGVVHAGNDEPGPAGGFVPSLATTR